MSQEQLWKYVLTLATFYNTAFDTVISSYYAKSGNGGYDLL